MRKKKIVQPEPRALPGVFSMQINVPNSVYGNCAHMMPDELIDWLRNMLALEDGQHVDYRFSGSGSCDNGFTDGITNVETVYIVYNLKEHDGLAFKIQFPKCRVHISQQYEYD